MLRIEATDKVIVMFILTLFFFSWCRRVISSTPDRLGHLDLVRFAAVAPPRVLVKVLRPYYLTINITDNRIFLIYILNKVSSI